MLYIDAHCHLADPRLESELEQVLARSRAQGIGGWIQGGVGPEDWDRQIRLAQAYPGRIIPVFGLHPWWVADPARTENDLQLGLELLMEKLPHAAGIGELGLDFGPRFGQKLGMASESLQVQAFGAQLGLARAMNLPVVLHVVKAHDQALAILEREGLPDAGGLVHSFSSSVEILERYVALGLTISVGGSVTWKRGQKAFEALQASMLKVPANRLVLETDSPDQPPESIRGELNEPATLIEIARVVGKMRGESPETLLKQSTENLVALFGIKNWS